MAIYRVSQKKGTNRRKKTLPKLRWGQILQCAWLGRAWSCVVLVRKDQKIGTPCIKVFKTVNNHQICQKNAPGPNNYLIIAQYCLDYSYFVYLADMRSSLLYRLEGYHFWMKYKTIDFGQIKVLILSARRRRRTWLAVFLRTFCYRSCTLLMCWTASRAGNGYLLLELMMTMMMVMIMVMMMMIMLMMIRALQNCFILPSRMGDFGVRWENAENLDNTKR